MASFNSTLSTSYLSCAEPVPHTGTDRCSTVAHSATSKPCLEPVSNKDSSCESNSLSNSAPASPSVPRLVEFEKTADRSHTAPQCVRLRNCSQPTIHVDSSSPHSTHSCSDLELDPDKEHEYGVYIDCRSYESTSASASFVTSVSSSTDSEADKCVTAPASKKKHRSRTRRALKRLLASPSHAHEQDRQMAFPHREFRSQYRRL